MGLRLVEPSRDREDRQLCDDLDHFYVTDAAERFAQSSRTIFRDVAFSA